jgi:DNA repair photolyase
VHVITKSNLVLRDVDLLSEIRRVHALITFSISTTDDDLGRKIEPGAALPSARFAALKELAAQGFYTGIAMMPVLPFLEDNPENIQAVVQRAAECGATYIVPWFGMSMRDRQREYFYAQLERHFPGLRARYEQRYGLHYECPASGAKQLANLFHAAIEQHHIADQVPFYTGQVKPKQLSLL